ncbi:MAG: PDZ domain-containing protein [Chitinophagaceae bacterium]
MMKFGNVQRAYLGVNYIDTKNASAEQISAYQLDKIEGIYINSVLENSSAKDAGIKEGDYITKINDKKIKTGPQMIEEIALHRPGDVVTVNFLRNNKEYTTSVKLKNSLGNTDVVKQSNTEKLGVVIRDLTAQELKSLGIKSGVLISEIKPNGIIAKQTRMKRNYIVTEINDSEIKSIIDFEKSFSKSSSDFQLGGIYPNYQGFYYYNIKPE